MLSAAGSSAAARYVFFRRRMAERARRRGMSDRVVDLPHIPNALVFIAVEATMKRYEDGYLGVRGAVLEAALAAYEEGFADGEDAAAESTPSEPTRADRATSTFGEWLRSKRESLGLGQEQLAAMTGLSNATISHLETGARGTKRGPYLTTLRKLADALGVPLDEIREQVRRTLRGS